MVRQVVSCFSQTAQVDDPLEPGGIGGGDEIPGRPQVAFEIGTILQDAAPSHGVNQVVGNLHPLHGSLETARVEDIALHQLHSRRTLAVSRQPFLRSDQTPGRHSPVL